MRAFMILILFVVCSFAWADAKPSASKSSKSSGQDKSEGRPGFSAEREAAALTFVSTHHPELRSVLDQLKSMQREEYKKAIQELFSTSERLTKIREYDAARYSIDLEEWKVKSRIQLLVAQAGVSEDPQVEKQLRELISRQADLKYSKALLDRDRAADRLEKAEEQLSRVKHDREATMEKQFTDAMRSVTKAREQFRKKDKRSSKK